MEIVSKRKTTERTSIDFRQKISLRGLTLLERKRL